MLSSAFGPKGGLSFLTGLQVSWLHPQTFILLWGTVIWRFASCALWSWERAVFCLQLSSLLTHFSSENNNTSLSIVSCVVWHSNVIFFFERKILSSLCFGRFCNYLWRNILAEYYIIYNIKKLSSWNQEIARKCTIWSSGKGTSFLYYSVCKCTL